MQGYYPFSLDKQHTEAALPLVQPLERYAPGTERYVRGMHLGGVCDNGEEDSSSEIFSICFLMFVLNCLKCDRDNTFVTLLQFVFLPL